jgi:hypothetical protein
MYRKRVQSVHDRQITKAQFARVDGQSQIREPAGEGAKCHSQLDAGELGADTPVKAVPERQMGTAASPWVEPIRIATERLVPVRAAQRADDDVTGADPGAEQIQVVAGEAGEGDLDDAEVAQQLIDHPVGRGVVLADQGERVRVL